MSTRTKEHQSQADKLASDIEAFLGKGGIVKCVEPEASNDKWLKQIDKVVRERGSEKTATDKFVFNGSL